MRQIIDLTVVGVALSVGILLTGGVQAEVFSSAPADQVDAVDGSGCGEPLSGGELHNLTGGQNVTQIDTFVVQDSNLEMNSPVSGNGIWAPINTGLITIDSGAFTNVSGITTVIQNSGNQVTINSATILNLYVDRP